MCADTWGMDTVTPPRRQTIDKEGVWLNRIIAWVCTLQERKRVLCTTE